MKNTLFIFSIAFFLFNFYSSYFAQNTERKKPEIKDFGSSLIRSPQENFNQPKKKKVTRDADTIYVETNLVVVDFLVLDKKGNAIYGLKQEDFIVTEDNKPQEIQTFTLGDDAQIPRSIVLIIDYSGSLLPYIERSVEAAKLLVDKLRPNDLMAIVTDDVKIISQFTSDKIQLKKKLDSLKKSALSGYTGKSMQFSSLYAVLNEMFDEEDIRPIILFQTDGDQLNGLRGGIGPLLGQRLYQKRITNIPPVPSNIKFSLNDLLEKIEKNRATIYSIIPGPKLIGISEEEKKEKKRLEGEKFRKFFVNRGLMAMPPSTIDRREQIKEELIKEYFPNGLLDEQESMVFLSNLSGGWTDFLEKPEDADKIYSRILSEINTRYVISYLPTNEAKDGKRRFIKVSVKNHPEYTILGRKSYIAPLPE
jgi:VWFA-related protein